MVGHPKHGWNKDIIPGHQSWSPLLSCVTELSHKRGGGGGNCPCTCEQSVNQAIGGE